ncbi:MAG: phosphoribosylpyrophosphate synthetase [Candidatus Komeilibacteria bacterium CG_4_9_14_0_8_um_filter_36_9]|uniref:ribose-phosphate diphosphokinase n=2 Tax=Candidatus Komeiliibacteriota TaxID=1817908 RepID=A0A2M8DQX2_9BACT|nr:MAG: phosphoribosylpyrophosphate synthetase [Candidatus Komeilibacteria bacterium CG_4_10_14_0_8_um_filter_37_78]PJC01768.1 MAG: phosphoribosylpyrophosphate synthetase [Candidatus Komeilibacteria bacterium CG_4_9_14_0_8_um_filter_36_9]
MRKQEIGDDIAVFGNTSTQHIIGGICRNLGIAPGKVYLGRHSDGEIKIQFQENIRNETLFIIANTGPDSDHIVELLLMIDAARRSSADKIIVVIPYFAYARQERKDRPRVPIAARMFADLLQSVGADHLVFTDLHAAAIQGFTTIPSDHIYARKTYLEYIRDCYQEEMETLMLMSADAGGVSMCQAYANRLGIPYGVIDKRRPTPGKSEVMNVIGDVKDKVCLFIDDMIDTAGSICNGSQAVLERGAVACDAMATHGVLSGSAIKRINDSSLRRVVVTDTLDVAVKAGRCQKLEPVSLISVWADVVRCMCHGESLAKLFEEDHLVY